jgi:sterol desaturase/sphingolipid hydroxylase (fatty acid hydroxylase superfamily)
MAVLTGIVHLAIGLLVLGALFFVLETLWPEVRGQPHWRRDAITDIIWWFVDDGTRLLATVGAVVFALIVIRLAAAPRPWFPQIAEQPAWLQAFEIVLIGDFLGYWIHRLFHRSSWLWPFHAVHHSSETVDWLSAARLHPVDGALHRLFPVSLLFVLGFSVKLVGPFLVFLTVYPIALHANVKLRFGWFGYLIVSPAFHRWHHTAEEQGLDKNFAGLFAIFDYIFGTAYLPDRQPRAYGLAGGRLPQDFWGQVLSPFRRRQTSAQAAVS